MARVGLDVSKKKGSLGLSGNCTLSHPAHGPGTIMVTLSVLPYSPHVSVKISMIHLLC